MHPVDGGPDECELLRRMADSTLEFPARREAWGMFYQRHAPYVHRACTRAHSKLIGLDRVPDAVSDTFLRAYEKASTFSLVGVAPDAQTRAVRGWLTRINENIVRDYFRNAPMVDFVAEETLEAGEAAQKNEDGRSMPGTSLSGHATLIELGLGTLSEREQRVLRETVFWYVDGAQQQRMPHAAMTRLATELGVTPSNIRQIRTRALGKLRQYVLDHLSGGAGHERKA